MKKMFLYIRLSDADDDLKNKTESNSVANQRASSWTTAFPAPMTAGRPLNG